MHILIIGGAGFVGSQMAVYLQQMGYKVSVMDNLARRGSEINISEFRRRNIAFYHGDVRTQESFNELPRNIDVICYTAAQPSVVYGYTNPMFDINNNALGTINCLEFVRAHGCGMIFWSTNKVYSGDRINHLPCIEGNTRWNWDREKAIIDSVTLPPGADLEYGISENFSIDGNQHSIYGLTKVMGDLACQEYSYAFKVPIVINRFSCLAGPGQFGKTEQGWVAWFAIAHHFNLPLQIIGWGGKQVRDVLFIGDVCRLIELEIKNMENLSGQVFNIGGGKNNTLSLIEALNLLESIYGHRVTTQVDETPRKGDQCIYISDIRKIQAILGWQPEIKIKDGYQQILEWVETNETWLRPLYT